MFKFYFFECLDKLAALVQWDQSVSTSIPVDLMIDFIVV